MKKLTILFVVTCFFVTGAAFATYGSEREQFYIGLEAGYFSPYGETDLGYGQSLSHDPGFEFGLKFIYYFDDNLGVNIRLSRTEFETEKKSYSFMGVNLWDMRAKYKTTTLGVGVSGRLPVHEMIDILGDLGLTLNYNEVEYHVLGWSETDDGTTLGFYANVGANYLITPQIAVGALLRYTYNKQSIEGGGDAQLGGISIMIALGYMF